jgi:hypothetical protein
MRLLMLLVAVSGIAGVTYPQNKPTDFSAQSRKSFDEMVAAKDPDIVSTLNDVHNSPAYACFSPDEDSFFVISYAAPKNLTNAFGWEPEKDTTGQPVDGYATQRAQMIYHKYKNGVDEAYRRAQFTWTKTFPYYEQKADQQHSVIAFAVGSEQNEHKDNQTIYNHAFDVSITDTEISLFFAFENLNNATTEFSFTIRKSTKRFVETYHIKDSKSTDDITYTGSCLDLAALTTLKKTTASP